MPCPHVTGERYHVYRIEMIELVANISDLEYSFFAREERPAPRRRESRS